VFLATLCLTLAVGVMGLGFVWAMLTMGRGPDRRDRY
jgi:hypothetical protein